MNETNLGINGSELPRITAISVQIQQQVQARAGPPALAAGCAVCRTQLQDQIGQQATQQTDRLRWSAAGSRGRYVSPQRGRRSRRASPATLARQVQCHLDTDRTALAPAPYRLARAETRPRAAEGESLNREAHSHNRDTLGGSARQPPSRQPCLAWHSRKGVPSDVHARGSVRPASARPPEPAHRGVVGDSTAACLSREKSPGFFPALETGV